MFRTIGLASLFGAAFAAHALTPGAHLDAKDAALQINQSGFICSEVVSLSMGSRNTLFNVRCVEFHDGTGRAHFAVDTANGLVMQTF